MMSKIEELLSAADTFNLFVETFKNTACCVIVTVLDITPSPETVTIAVRALSVILAWAVTTRVALFEPEVLLTVNQL
jgi:hypothetical protein